MKTRRVIGFRVDVAGKRRSLSISVQFNPCEWMVGVDVYKGADFVDVTIHLFPTISISVEHWRPRRIDKRKR